MTNLSIRQGDDFARLALVLARTNGDLVWAAEAAATSWGASSGAAMTLKAATAAGTIGSSSWAGALAPFQALANDFLEYIRPSSIVGKLLGLREIPANTRIVGITTGAGAGWSSEGSPTAFSALALAPIDPLVPKRVSATVPLTVELARLSTPAAEGLVKTELSQAINAATDSAFIDPSNAGSAAKPASITNGVTAITATTDASKDLAVLIAAFTGDLATACFVMSPKLATALSGADRPDIGARGGSLLGIPVITSGAVPAGVLVLIDPNRVLFVDDGLTIDVSADATPQLSDSPDNPPTAGTVAISLWQNNLIAVRTQRMLNWKAASGAVALLSGANY